MNNVRKGLKQGIKYLSNPMFWVGNVVGCVLYFRYRGPVSPGQMMAEWITAGLLVSAYLIIRDEGKVYRRAARIAFLRRARSR